MGLPKQYAQCVWLVRREVCGVILRAEVALVSSCALLARHVAGDDERADQLLVERTSHLSRVLFWRRWWVS